MVVATYLHWMDHRIRISAHIRIKVVGYTAPRLPGRLGVCDRLHLAGPAEYYLEDKDDARDALGVAVL